MSDDLQLPGVYPCNKYPQITKSQKLEMLLDDITFLSMSGFIAFVVGLLPAALYTIVYGNGWIPHIIPWCFAIAVPVALLLNAFEQRRD